MSNPLILAASDTLSELSSSTRGREQIEVVTARSSAAVCGEDLFEHGGDFDLRTSAAMKKASG